MSASGIAITVPAGAMLGATKPVSDIGPSMPSPVFAWRTRT
jgi:hypothetical protein